MAFFSSQPERVDRISNLRPEQEEIFSNQIAGLQGRGAGGVGGTSADYYRDLAEGGGRDEFEAPLMRQFQEDIIPGLAEQFAGLGAGGLSSGNFIQEAGRAGTDLSERIGHLRAQLRQQGIEGLQGLQQNALAPQDQLLFRPRQESVVEKFAGSAASGAGKAAGKALGGSLASGVGNLFDSFMEK